MAGAEVRRVDVIPVGTIINANDGVKTDPWQSGIIPARVNVSERKWGFNVHPHDRRRVAARKEDK